MKIAISKKLQRTFISDKQEQKFIADFRAWKSSADPCSFKRFGKDVATAIPVGHDFDKLMHVHLAPLNQLGQADDEESYQRWCDAFASKTQNIRCNRQSDLLLYYATYQGDYYLIMVDNHGVMKPPLDRLNDICALADRWVASKRTPKT